MLAVTKFALLAVAPALTAPSPAANPLPVVLAAKPDVKFETTLTPVSDTEVRAKLVVWVSAFGKSVGPVELFEAGLDKAGRPAVRREKKILGFRFAASAEWKNNVVIFKLSAKAPKGHLGWSWTRVEPLVTK